MPKLTTKKSAFNASVTLYEPVQGLRRSSRVKSPYAIPTADIEDLVDEEEDDELPSTSGPSKPAPRKRATTTAARKGKSKASPKKPLLVAHETPKNWAEVYDTIKSMRTRFVAPVDTMGCEAAGLKLGDPDARNCRFATLVSLILSTQTKDETTDAAMTKLKQALGGTISVDLVLNAETETIANAVNKVGFWQAKAKNLQTTAKMLKDKFDSDVPKTIEELTSLAGVGPKVGFLALQCCWNISSGIGVDTHVHRITNRLGWHKTKDNESTRVHLESWLPRDKWAHINLMMVGFGQVICTPVSPRCDLCDVGKKGLCPSMEVVKNAEKRKAIPWVKSEAKVEVEVEIDLDGVKVEMDLDEEKAEDIKREVDIDGVKVEEDTPMAVEQVKMEPAIILKSEDV